MTIATAEDRTKPEATLHAGELLEGKYRVEFLLGQGGMAAVWAGTNERTGKRVALKVLLPSLTAMPGVDSLFQREGFAVSRIDHPNVVTVFDLMQHEGMACIVMELLTGETLDKLIERNSVLEVNEACALLLPAMRGVSAAHAQGVIHRDLKPQNIFVCMGPDGRVVTTKVLDFGISLMLGRAREPAVGQGPNTFMGTPAYMAPEQIWGGAPIDARADVYGLGVLFYETLTGRVPFPGQPGAALFERILDDPPPPLAEARPDLSPDFSRIIEIAMAKSPGERYATVDAMITAVENEILPATPHPRALTPVRGIASGLPLEVATGRRATPVEGVYRREPTGEHQATKFLVGFPLEASVPVGQGRTGNLGPEERLESAASADDTAPVLTARAWARSKLRRLSQPRRWPAWGRVGAVALLVGTTFGLWARARHRSYEIPDLPPLAMRAGLPTGPQPVPPPSAPAVVVTPLAPLAPSAASASEDAIAAAARAPTSAPIRITRAAPRSTAKLALVDDSRTARDRRLTLAGALNRNATPTSRAGMAKAPAARLRAGKLSADDF